ncbi:putative MFS family arabinose efflux permease [Catenulispora sp. GP43]|uniref:MFS transporter n=1 Tax=Catenulispora sp. GP43 TaxID=3156263 RepID=UPI003519CF7A
MTTSALAHQKVGVPTGIHKSLGPDAGLSKKTTALFSVAAGTAVANLYYAQPLLTSIARTFALGPGTASLIATLGQIGYTVGLALLVPLADIVNRRKLLVVLLLVTSVALAVSAAAPGFAVLAVAAAVLSTTAVAGPVLVPLAATLASPQQRGAVTGSVMSGVLMGVLLSRTAGGLLAQLAGWRAVYAVAAVATLALAEVLRRVLPDVAPVARLGYGALLGSVVKLVREEPALRLRMAFGFLGFGSFSVLWTSIAFQLARPPYSFGEAAIGLLGLAGAAGAIAAKATGRAVDAGRDRAVSGLMFTAMLLGWLLLGVHGGHWLLPLILGIVVLDLGVQGAHVTNLAVALRLRPEARSRITTAYMTSVFLGGVAGSAASGAVFASGGWNAVTLTGAAFSGVALAIWAVFRDAK